MAENSEENRDKRLDNLRPFQPGQSGNPNGRPVGHRNYATLYREALIKLAEQDNMDPDDVEVELIANALRYARKGHYQFYRDIMNRLHGKEPKTVVDPGGLFSATELVIHVVNSRDELEQEDKIEPKPDPSS